MVQTEYSWMTTLELVDFVELRGSRTTLEIELAQRLAAADAEIKDIGDGDSQWGPFNGNHT